MNFNHLRCLADRDLRLQNCLGNGLISGLNSLIEHNSYSLKVELLMSLLSENREEKGEKSGLFRVSKG